MVESRVEWWDVSNGGESEGCALLMEEGSAAEHPIVPSPPKPKDFVMHVEVANVVLKKDVKVGRDDPSFATSILFAKNLSMVRLCARSRLSNS